MNILASKVLRKRIGVVSILLVFAISLSNTIVFAHGGEDHGDTKPQTQTNGKGTVLRSARIGDLEIMIKHVLLEPDTAVQGRLFITKFETNEAVDGSNIKVEIESANGSVTAIPVEKSDSVGIYLLKIPALPEGAYTVRAKMDAGAKTDTATFSGVRVERPPTAVDEPGTSWLGIILMLLVGSILAMFGGLIYFAWRFAGNEQVVDEAVTV